MPKSSGPGRKMGTRAWTTIMFVAPVLLSVLATTLFLFRIIDWEGVGNLMLLAVISALVPSIPYWRSMDEPSREAHKFAVFWGMGLALMLVVLVGFQMMFSRGARELVQGLVESFMSFSKGFFGEQQGAVGFSLGVFMSVYVLLLGYGLTWLGWWARQRVGTKAD